MKKKIAVLTLCAMLFALCVAADAQQTGKIFRIGFLDSSTAAGSAVLLEAFRQELSKLGWNEGKNVAFVPGILSVEFSQAAAPQLEWNEKESRDEPEELWIHGRAYLWAMDMPQSKRNENRYFCRHRTVARVAIRLRGVADLIHPPGGLALRKRVG